MYFLTVYSGRPGTAAARASSDMNGKEGLYTVSIADAVAGPMPCRNFGSSNKVWTTVAVPNPQAVQLPSFNGYYCLEMCT